jgi:hypothetical protein
MSVKAGDRRKVKDAPPSDQVAAVRKLVQALDLPRARQRLAALRAAYPAFKPLYGLAWEIEDAGGYPMAACAAAWAWHQASPGSRAALEALVENARGAMLVGLAVRAQHRLRQLDEGPGVPEPVEHIDAPLGRLTLAEAEGLDLGRMFLANDDPAAARTALEGIDHPSARNNLALAGFFEGRVAHAAELAEANWRADTANLFALEQLVRWRCWTAGLADCRDYADVLRQTRARRPEEALARCLALQLLGDEQAMRQAHTEESGAAYWQGATDQQLDLFDLLIDPRADEESLGEDATWFPRRWRKQLGAAAGPLRRGEAGAQARWDAQLDACDAHADYLLRAVQWGPVTVRRVAREVLLRRAGLGDAPALAALLGSLTSARGADHERNALMASLTERGLCDAGQPVEVFLRGELRRVKPIGQRIHAEPTPSPFSAPVQALVERMHAAIGRNDMDQALRLAEKVRALEPEQPAAWANLAALQEGTGVPIEQIAASFRRAHELAPDYIFARCGLSRTLAQQGRLDEAAELLQGLDGRAEWHHSEYRSYLMSQRELAQARGQHDVVAELESALGHLMRQFAG